MSAEADDRPGDPAGDRRRAGASADQYFATDPRVGSHAHTVEVVLPGAAFTLETDRGVFSHGHLDAGTAVLLREELPLPATGQLLDLGCGSGAIALAMALRAPGATVWAVDVNRRARELCARNAARNRVAGIRVAAPEDVPADLRFAAIWSNPPIRIGKAALHALLTEWLDRLEPDGTAVLVVHKHLGADSLQRWLDEAGFPTQRLRSRSGFRLLAVAAATSRA
jgi:16S rRNA (guanine1207-N2)-methyltransferase